MTLTLILTLTLTLVPEIEYDPSARRSALVVTWPRSEPHCGSVRHMVPVASPEISWGAYLVRGWCSGSGRDRGRGRSRVVVTHR